MVEKDFQSKFGKWIREHKDNLEIRPAVYELKLAKGGSFAFDKVKDHQVKALSEAKHEGLYHKIADQTIGKGGKFGMTLKKPFDCLYIKQSAYIVIGFYTPRQKIEAVFVDIDNFIKTRDYYLLKGRKSIKKEEWKQISNKFFRI